MTAGTATPNPPETRPGHGSEPAGRASFGHVLWAEWTKFRTARGCVIGMVVAGLLTVRMTSLTGKLPSASGGRVQAGHGAQSSLHPGLEPWSKAGIIIKASTRQGSAYAAVLASGDNGVRMQYDYTGDIAGPPGRPSAASPRWL